MTSDHRLGHRWGDLRRRLRLDKFYDAIKEVFPPMALYTLLGVPALIFAVFTILISSLTREGVFEDKAQQFANLLLEPGGDAVMHSTPSRSDKKILIVEIDDGTLNWLGTKEESRIFLHCLVQRIAKLKPRAIGLDYTFSAVNDAGLKAGGSATCPDNQTISLMPFDQLDVPVVMLAEMVENKFTRAWDIVPPSPVMLSSGADKKRHLGFGNVTLGIRNETMRAQRLITSDPRKIEPVASNDSETIEPIASFAYAVWAAGQSESLEYSSAANYLEVQREKVAQFDNRLNSLGELNLRFLHPDQVFNTRSAFAIYNTPLKRTTMDMTLQRFVADKYVLIGNTAEQTGDLFNHPLNTQLPFVPGFFRENILFGKFPGVYLHGYTLSNLEQTAPGVQIDSGRAPFFHPLIALFLPLILYVVFYSLPIEKLALTWGGWHSPAINGGLIYWIISGVGFASIYWSLLRYFNFSLDTWFGFLISAAVLCGAIAYRQSFAVLMLTVAYCAWAFSRASMTLAEGNPSFQISTMFVLAMLGYLIATILNMIFRGMRHRNMIDMLTRHNSNEYFTADTFRGHDQYSRLNLFEKFDSAVVCSLDLGDFFENRQFSPSHISGRLGRLQDHFESVLHGLLEEFRSADGNNKLDKNDYLIMIDNYGHNLLNAYILPANARSRAAWSKPETGTGEELRQYLSQNKELSEMVDVSDKTPAQFCPVQIEVGALHILDIPSRVEAGVLTASGPVIKILGQRMPAAGRPTEEHDALTDNVAALKMPDGNTQDAQHQPDEDSP